MTLRPAFSSIGGGLSPAMFPFQPRTSQLQRFLLRSSPLQWNILGSHRLGEPQALAPSVPTSHLPTPIPSASLPSVFSGAYGPSTAPLDGVAASTSAPPPQHIMISTRDFLTIMDAVRTFSTIAASFSTTHAALVDRMTRTEAAMAQTSAILAQNQAILMQIQSHLGLPAISPYVLAQTLPTPTPAGAMPPPPPVPAGSLVILAVATGATTPLAAPQPVQTEDASSPATD